MLNGNGRAARLKVSAIFWILAATVTAGGQSPSRWTSTAGAQVLLKTNSTQVGEANSGLPTPLADLI